MENSSNKTVQSYQELLELALQYKDLLPWNGRHKLIKDHLTSRQIVRSDSKIRTVLTGQTRDVDVLVAVIELGKIESQKVATALS